MQPKSCHSCCDGKQKPKKKNNKKIMSKKERNVTLIDCGSYSS